jgi:hypothetical protein
VEIEVIQVPFISVSSVVIVLEIMHNCANALSWAMQQDTQNLVKQFENDQPLKGSCLVRDFVCSGPNYTYLYSTSTGSMVVPLSP